MARIIRLVNMAKWYIFIVFPACKESIPLALDQVLKLGLLPESPVRSFEYIPK